MGGWRRLQESQEALAVGIQRGVRGHPRSAAGEAGEEEKPVNDSLLENGHMYRMPLVCLFTICSFS